MKTQLDLTEFDEVLDELGGLTRAELAELVTSRIPAHDVASFVALAWAEHRCASLRVGSDASAKGNARWVGGRLSCAPDGAIAMAGTIDRTSKTARLACLAQSTPADRNDSAATSMAARESPVPVTQLTNTQERGWRWTWPTSQRTSLELPVFALDGAIGPGGVERMFARRANDDAGWLDDISRTVCIASLPTGRASS